MTILLRTAVLILFICCVFNPALPGLAAEGSRYGQWQTAENQLEKMIKELDQIIAAGIKAKAAHPDFLKDLQNTLDLYRIPKKTVLFSDDFADNDFSSNPVWQIRQGEYIIDRYGSLYSSVAIKKPPPPKEEGTEEDSGGDRGIRVLLGVLNELAKDDMENQAGTETPLDQAVISSNAHIPNSFILEYTFRSTSNWGKTSIGVFQGDELKSGYHLIYQALPGQDRPMQLIRYRYAKPF
ncbi:MAG: hypothetical protein R3297_07070, partial [Desulfobulbales bacterium]|nr:hypothetical protein [Desulfobulbales bacterium]